VLTASRDRHEAAPAAPEDVFTIAAREKAQATLAALFSGRTAQPRDEAGRFTSSGFDGGARQPLPVRRDPEREHGQLVAQLVSLRRIYGGPSF
jgi:hypothetical protein